MHYYWIKSEGSRMAHSIQVAIINQNGCTIFISRVCIPICSIYPYNFPIDKVVWQIFCRLGC